MKKIIFLMVALLLLGTSNAFAAFVNGGFEAGDFSGWTRNGGQYSSGSYSWLGDPGKSAVVGVGTDPITGNNLSTVYNGQSAVRVNDGDSYYTGWGGYHFSTIEQTVTNWTDPNIYFAYAAVIQDPGHSYAGHMGLVLEDLTSQTTLFDVYFDYYTAGTVLGNANWHNYNGWGYTDWNVVQLDTTNSIGHDLKLRLLASDCGYGGHSGYAYLDGFGGSAPVFNPGGTDNVVPEPASMILMGIGLAGAALRRRKR